MSINDTTRKLRILCYDLESLSLQDIINLILSDNEQIVYRKIYTDEKGRDAIIFSNTARGVIAASASIINASELDYYLQWSLPVGWAVNTAKVYEDNKNEIYYTVFHDFDIKTFKHIQEKGWNIEYIFEAIDALMPGFKEIADSIELAKLICESISLLKTRSITIVLSNTETLTIDIPDGEWHIRVKQKPTGWYINTEKIIEHHHEAAKIYREKYNIDEIVYKYIEKMYQEYQLMIKRLMEVFELFKLAGVRE